MKLLSWNHNTSFFLWHHFMKVVLKEQKYLDNCEFFFIFLTFATRLWKNDEYFTLWNFDRVFRKLWVLFDLFAITRNLCVYLLYHHINNIKHWFYEKSFEVVNPIFLMRQQSTTRKFFFMTKTKRFYTVIFVWSPL